MKTALLLKGILFYVTFAMCIFAVASIQSLYDNGHLFDALVIITTFIYLCKQTISKEEFDIISFDKFFKKHNL